MYEYDETLYDEGWTGSLSRYCSQNPQSPTCDDVASYYAYRIDVKPNALLAGFFAFSLLCSAVTHYKTRTGHAFNAAMMLGVACELAGYACRLASARNPWKRAPFLVQLCLLTTGPAFLAAGIYLCLRRVVVVFGAEHSRIPPRWYPRVFVPCDLASLVLQAVGSGLAAVGNHKGTPVTTAAAEAVMVAGLAFQVFTMLAFMLVAGDFALRVRRSERAAAAAGSAAWLAPAMLSPEAAALRELRGDRRFYAFLGALGLATVCVFWRCVFRVAELCRGWVNPIMERQDLFFGFEGTMVAVAVLALNLFHPAFCREKFLQVKRDGRDKTEAFSMQTTTST